MIVPVCKSVCETLEFRDKIFGLWIHGCYLLASVLWERRTWKEQGEVAVVGLGDGISD